MKTAITLDRARKQEGGWLMAASAEFTALAGRKGIEDFLSAPPSRFGGGCADDKGSHPRIDPRMWGWRLFLSNADEDAGSKKKKKIVQRT